MEKKKLSKVSFDNVSDVTEDFVIKNFILSDSSKIPNHISFDHPFMFGGLIFGICIKGSAVCKISFHEYEITANTIFTILPNQILEPVSKSEDFFVEILLFSFDFFSGLPLPKNLDIVNKMVRQPCLEISDSEKQNLIEYHSFIVKAYHREGLLYKEEIAKSLLYALLAEIASIYSGNEIKVNPEIKTRGEDITYQFLHLLREHHKQERSASFYADKLCITTKYLSGTLKKTTGKSINSWINDVVIIEAKVLLKSSDMTVLQISEELNFPNPSFFGRFFKQYAGMTPLEYREMK